MESDLQVMVKGFENEYAQSIGNAIAEVLHALPEIGPRLDLRRMHRIVVTADFAGELAELSQQNPSRTPMTHTKEEYGEAVAQVLLFPKGDGLEILPVLSAGTVAPLVMGEETEENIDRFQFALHLLHHELCHVHDDNQKIDAFKGIIMKVSYSGKDNHIRPLAEVLWSEYLANFLSSPTANEAFTSSTLGMLADAIERTKKIIDKEIYAYRTHADLMHVLTILQRHGGFLIKSAAYCLGYADGKANPDFFSKVTDVVSGSYFEKTFTAMHQVLIEMKKLYPAEWQDLKIYDALASVTEEFFKDLGFIFSNMEDGRVYISIP